jgi:hypothetical protein
VAVKSPTDSLHEIQRFFDLSPEDLATVMGVHRRSIDRWLQGTTDPRGVTLRELGRLETLRDLLLQAHKTPQASLEWLRRPNRAFGGSSPLNILLATGSADVLAYLKRADEGVYA